MAQVLPYTKMERLVLRSTGVSQKQLDILGPMLQHAPSLRIFEIPSNSLRVSELETLPKYLVNTNIETLNLSSNYLMERSGWLLVRFIALPQLKSLDISMSGLSRETYNNLIEPILQSGLTMFVANRFRGYIELDKYDSNPRFQRISPKDNIVIAYHVLR
jgi:hypothetical protein